MFEQPIPVKWHMTFLTMTVTPNEVWLPKELPKESIANRKISKLIPLRRCQLVSINVCSGKICYIFSSIFFCILNDHGNLNLGLWVKLHCYICYVLFKLLTLNWNEMKKFNLKSTWQNPPKCLIIHWMTLQYCKMAMTKLTK